MEPTIEEIKKLIDELFSDELMHDETPMGAKRRSTIRTKLKTWSWS